MNDTTTQTEKTGLGRKTTVAVCVLAVLLAAGAAAVIFSTEPTAQRETATRTSAMLVDTVEASQGTYRPQVVETGVVMPSRDIQLSPQIDGRITAMHDDFVPGGFVARGQTLVEIEAADYEIALKQRESELLQAKTDLELEMGRQAIARQDFELLGDILPDGDTSLVLREPQLAAARVRVDAAQAAVEQARLNLARTRIRSPFDAQVLTRNVNLGSQVAAGTPLARLVGVDNYWVMATVGLSKIPYLEFPRDDTAGATVELRNRSAWPAGASRNGRLYRLVGALEEQTRMARVVIEVDDPLARTARDVPPLLIGEYVEVRIAGKPIADVVRLNREHLRKNDTAWVMDADNKLRIRELDVVFLDAAHAYVRAGLTGGERVVVTDLATVSDGADLRLEAGGDAVTAGNE